MKVRNGDESLPMFILNDITFTKWMNINMIILEYMVIYLRQGKSPVEVLTFVN